MTGSTAGAPTSRLMPRLCAFACCLALAGGANALSSSDRPAVIEEAAADGLPTAFLEAKWREARVKRVPTERVRQVLETFVTRLRLADRMVPRGPLAAQAREAVVDAVAVALAAGAAPELLSTALAAAGDGRGQLLAAQAMTSLLAAGIDSSDATRLVIATLRSGQVERLLSLRPALEVLRVAGYGDGDAALELMRGIERGRAPLEAANEMRLTADSANRAGDAAPAPGGAGGPDRDRADRSRDEDRPDRSGKKEK